MALRWWKLTVNWLVLMGQAAPCRAVPCQGAVPAVPCRAILCCAKPSRASHVVLFRAVLCQPLSFRLCDEASLTTISLANGSCSQYDRSAAMVQELGHQFDSFQNKVRSAPAGSRRRLRVWEP